MLKPSLKHWMGSAKSNAKGRIFLSNLTNDILCNHLTPNVLKSFFDHVISDIEGGIDLKSGESIFSQSTSLAIETNELSLRGPQLPDDLKQKSKLLETDTLVVVVNVSEFFLRNFFDLSTLGSCEWNVDPRETLGLIQGVADINTIINPDMKIGGKHSMVWLTTPKSLNLSAIDKPTLSPDDVRDRVGLAHFNEDNYLALLFIPLSQIDTKLRKPTTLDGGLNLVFCTNKNSDGFGLTIDLKSVEPKCIEVVTDEIPATKIEAICGIGRVVSTINVLWPEFENKLHATTDVSILDDFLASQYQV